MVAPIVGEKYAWAGVREATVTQEFPVASGVVDFGTGTPDQHSGFRVELFGFGRTKMLNFGCILLLWLFSSSPPNFIRFWQVWAELRCREARMLVCNYFAYFHCAFSCSRAHLFYLLRPLVFLLQLIIDFPSGVINFVLALFLAQLLAAADWLLTINCQFINFLKL